MWIVGIDLAWGEKKRDGVCVLALNKGRAMIEKFGYPFGDDDLLSFLEPYCQTSKKVLIALDAPVICLNESGARPVDREMHRLFGKQHAGCHPVNKKLCPRVIRVVQKIQRLPSVSSKGSSKGSSRKKMELPIYGLPWLFEVYPHAALVRFFELERIIKYKRGTVVEKRLEFHRLQTLLQEKLPALFPHFEPGPEFKALVQMSWTKEVEDRTDALLCALIGLWHCQHRGKKSQMVGDRAQGFIVVPKW